MAKPSRPAKGSTSTAKPKKKDPTARNTAGAKFSVYGMSENMKRRAREADKAEGRIRGN